MAITIEWLKQAANSKSFSKGKSYCNAVDDLVKRGSSYSAKVSGSEEYEVVITDNPNGQPLTDCDCPYDYDGICKHIVAVGLNIIDGKYETESDDGEEDDDDDEEIAEIKPVSIKKAAQQKTELPSNASFYDEVFLKKEETVRAAFLRLLFANEEKLRQQFNQFSKPPTQKKPKAIEEKLIEKTTDKVNKKLSKISDLDADDYHSSQSRGYGRGYSRGYYDYDDEGDGLSDWIIEKIEIIFEPFVKDAKEHIQNGNIVAATEILIGMYEGCLGLEFDSDIDDYMDGDFEIVALEEFTGMLESLDDAMQSAILQEDSIKTSILLILDRWKKRSDYADTVSLFEDYFKNLSHQPEMAHWLIKELKERKLTLELISLTLTNAETIKDDVLWIESAESVAAENHVVMQLLLEKYSALNRQTEFHKAAKKAFKFEHNNFVPYLKTKVSADFDSELYVDVFIKSATQDSSLEDFMTVRPLLSKKREADFMDYCQKNKVNLYIEILNHESRFDEILTLIEESIKSHSTSTYSFYNSFDIPKAISYIIEKFPDDVFDIVQLQTENALKKMNMDRKGYAHACAHLRPLKKLPKSHQSDFRTYLNSLRDRFRGRPAFVDELSKI